MTSAAATEMQSERDLPSILFLGDRALGEQLAAALPEAHVRTADSRQQAEIALADSEPDLVVTDTRQAWVRDLPDPLTAHRTVKGSAPRIAWAAPSEGQGKDAPALAALLEGISRELAMRLPSVDRQADYRSLFQGMPTGLYRSTPTGRILDANPALVQMLGFPDRKTLLEVNAADLHLHPEDRRRVEAELGEHGVVRSEELCLRRRDGSPLWVEESARRVPGPDGKTSYYEGALIDISERKRTELAVQRRDAILKAVTFAGEQFLQTTPWTACIDDVLARIGQAANASRAYLFAFHTDPKGRPVASQRFEWVARGIEPQIDNP